jgi:RNA-directed DNA polymerase
MTDALTSLDMSTGLRKVADRAKREPAARFNSLAHLIDEELLAGAYARLRSDAAVGVDGITKEQYGQDLQNKLRDLHERLKTMRYRHQPIRRMHIPKEKKGQTRPIGISTVSANYPGTQRVFGMDGSSTSIPPAERSAFPRP